MIEPRRNPAEVQKRPVDIIWNITLICPWDCQICCTNAVWTTRRNGIVHLADIGQGTQQAIPYEHGSGSTYEQALRLRQQLGLELDLASKHRVLDHLEGFRPKIDFSGGDPLVVRENYEIMRSASARFGRSQITLTATGAGLARYGTTEVAQWIGELNFTYDGIASDDNPNRPEGYAQGNLKRAAQFANAGTKVRGECPLSVYNIGTETLTKLYYDLHEAGVSTLLLMRLFPVGRGTFKAADIPTIQQYKRAVDLLRGMEAKLGYPKLKLQCALRFLDTQDMRENPCDLISESFGLMADGTLLASPWAVGSNGKPLDDAWVLGNLSRTPLHEILSSEKVQRFATRLDDNFGHCKIFAFLHSNRKVPADRMLDHADPLYSALVVPSTK